MKPDWDKLMKEYDGHTDVVIGDVDCTAGGKSLCEKMGVRGYPTIKYGDPDDLQDYQQGRDLKALQKFAKTLGPTCGPAHLELCDAEKKAKIDELKALGEQERAALIKEQEDAMEKVEADFKSFVEGLQKSYEAANKKKTDDVKSIKDGGLGLLKSVHAFEKKAKSEL